MEGSDHILVFVVGIQYRRAGADVASGRLSLSRWSRLERWNLDNHPFGQIFDFLKGFLSRKKQKVGPSVYAAFRPSRALLTQPRSNRLFRGISNGFVQ
jgi:hypothetical protein